MARKRERPMKLHEPPLLAHQARVLTRISTETLLEWLATPAQRSTRTLRALVTAELCFRVSRLAYKPPIGNVCFDDITIYRRVWADVFGSRVPVPPGFGAASDAYPHEREWG